MKYSYILLEPAQEEFESSLRWYVVRSEQSAENFIKAIDVAIELICNYPTSWRNKNKDFYELGTKKYPYTIIYKIDNYNDVAYFRLDVSYRRHDAHRVWSN